MRRPSSTMRNDVSQRKEVRSHLLERVVASLEAPKLVKRLDNAPPEIYSRDWEPLKINKLDQNRIDQDNRKRQQYKEDLSAKVNISETMSIEEIVEPRLKVKVPANFKSLSSTKLYGKLVTLNLLTPEQAQDLFATLGGRRVETKFDILFQSVDTKVRIPEVKMLQVIVPEGFKSLKVTDQYAYLVRQLALLPEEANDVIAILKGKDPLSSIFFDIIEE